MRDGNVSLTGHGLEYGQQGIGMFLGVLGVKVCGRQTYRRTEPGRKNPQRERDQRIDESAWVSGQPTQRVSDSL
jgi:hypothetical protein